MALQLGNVDIQLTNAAAPILQVSSNGMIAILKATAVNTDTSPRNISIWRVLNGGTPGVTNLIIDAMPIGAGETLVLPLSGQTLVQLQNLEAAADVTSVVNISLSYALTP